MMGAGDAVLQQGSGTRVGWRKEASDLDEIPTWLNAATIVVSAVFSLIALIVSVFGLRSSREANRISRESKEIAQVSYEANNLPKLTVEATAAADFSGFATMLEGQNYVMRPPPAFEAPTPIFIATASAIVRAPSHACYGVHRVGLQRAALAAGFDPDRCAGHCLHAELVANFTAGAGATAASWTRPGITA